MQYEPTPVGNRVHALVVDDQPSTTMLVHAILGRVGYAVDECATGREAIAALDTAHYDLMVLDLNLPDMSGLDLLRARPPERLPPVLGITSGITPDMIERAEAVGMNHILEKPISGERLLANAAAVMRDARPTEIVACGGPPIDRAVLLDIKAGNGDALFQRFVDQALADAWHCLCELENVPASDIAAWHQHVRTLDGVARSLGARRLASMIAEVQLSPSWRLHEMTGSLIGQFKRLLEEAQDALGEWLRPFSEHAGEEPEPHEFAAEPAKLSERELEVLRWIAEGKTSSETASILGISERTVTYHITNILFKLDAVNKTQAVVKAVMLRLIR